MQKIPIAIVGLNFGKWMVEDIVNGVAKPFFQLAAVCDLDIAKAKAFSETYKVPYYTDFDQLLSNKDIPTIGLYTGPVGRAGLLQKIIEAGKDVMTTKPFELDCHAALQVLHKAKELGRVIHLNSPGPCLPDDLATALSWASKHNLGRPVACQLNSWVRYDEKPDGSWYDDPQKCPVAPVFRLGIYLINDLVSIFGEAEKVTVISSRLFTERPTVDQGQLSILFKNGAMANIFASFCIADGDQYQNGMILSYERGTIYRNLGPHRSTRAGDGQCELALVMGNPQEPQKRRIEESVVMSGTSGSYQWENFAKAVRQQPIQSNTSPETIVAGLRIVQAMAEASLGSGVARVKSVHSQD
jgi:predicted dehydrogenase